MSWCVFLVVFWCRYCGWFSSRFSFRPSTRFPRFVPRLAFGPFCPFRSSSRSSLRFSFRPSFRLFVWACRKAVRLRRGVRLVACRGGVAWRLPCAPFLSARVRWCVWASRFSFCSSRLVSRLFCLFRRGERCVASLFSLASLVSVRHFARCLGWDAVAVWCRPVSRLVPPSRVGVSFVVSALASRPSVSCRRFVPSGRCLRLVSAGVSCRCCFVAPFLSARFPVSSRLRSVAAVVLFVFVPSGVSDGGVFVAVWVWRRSVVAAWRCGVAWRRACRCAWRGGVSVGGSVMSCRAGRGVA